MALTKSDEKRRVGAAVRVPFVKRCTVQLASAAPQDAFIVNINVLGAYVALEALPALGQPVSFRFQLPGSEREATVDGVVAWTNPRQEHPVHSLPPGFGLAFRNLDADTKSRIEDIVFDYMKRQPVDE